MKKVVAMLLSAFLLGGLVTGCGQPMASSSPKPNGTMVRPASSSQTESAPPLNEPLHVFLPTEETVLAEILKTIAEQQGMQLQIATTPQGILYTEKLAAALQGDNPPTIYWLGGEQQAEELRQQDVPLANLAGGKFSASIKSLAQMVPPVVGLTGDKNAPAGLPVGMYATGTLVNLGLLGSLLNAPSLQTLQKDLEECSWEQWEVLLQTVNNFLQKPQQGKITLGKNEYTLLRFRPEEAQSVRGLFAFPTAEGVLLMDSEWEALFANGFVTSQQWEETPLEQKTEKMVPLLEQLYQGLDTQTNYMAGEETSFAKGEGALRQILTSNGAKNLFAQGKALLLKGDTRLGLEMEQQNPHLQGKLGIIPVKMPWQEGANGKQTNTMVGIETLGYLCLQPNRPDTPRGEDILLAVFTTEEGNEMLESKLYGVSPFFTGGESVLAKQVENYIAKENVFKRIVPAQTTAELNKALSEFVQRDLLPQEKWNEEQQALFVGTALEVLLLPKPA